MTLHELLYLHIGCTYTDETLYILLLDLPLHAAVGFVLIILFTPLYRALSQNFLAILCYVHRYLLYLHNRSTPITDKNGKKPMDINTLAGTEIV